MTIFLLLNGLGVAFLIYVLANFLKEGRQKKHGALRPYRLSAQYGSDRQVFVVTSPIASSARKLNETSMLQFPDGKVRTKTAGTDPGEPENKTLLRKYASR
jgi:hypothetical protein